MSPRSVECRKLPNKLKGQGELDRISGLPDEVLGHILSYLPTKCAVGTSVLSTRWKYLFSLTTNLYFEEAYTVIDITAEERKARKNSFKKFVYRVLALHQKSIKDFSLDCENWYGNSHLNVWISAAILKKVQRLYLHLGVVYVDKGQSLPSCLFNSRTLEGLKINASLDLEVPNFVWLPRLKEVHLKSLRFLKGTSVARLFSGCSSLEVLTFEDIHFGGGNASIFSSTLKELTIIDTFSSVWIEIDAPNLRDVTFLYLSGTDFWYDYRPPLAFDVLKDPASVTYLALQGVSLGLVDCYGIPNYPNFAFLELYYCPDYRWKATIDLLCSSPRLEIVIFREGVRNISGDKEWEEWPLWLWEASLPLNVEVIEIHYFSGTERELILLEYLLRNAVELKWLTLYKSCDMEMEQELRMTKELLMLPRISYHCRIDII